jgi:hypothetical protein
LAFGIWRLAFLQANKLLVITQLLMGEIPERALFRQADVARSLRPYLHLTQAVRVGDLNAFAQVMQQHGEAFKRDATFTLITRYAALIPSSQTSSFFIIFFQKFLSHSLFSYSYSLFHIHCRSRPVCATM